MKEQFESFYNERLKQFGHGAKGVGWKNEDAQKIRFAQLAKIVTNAENHFCLNDLGCGLGDFVSYLNEHNFKFTYTGYDVLSEMISEACRRFDKFPSTNFRVIKTASEMGVTDYTIASGIFNIRFNCDDDTWLQYILETLETINARSTRGFAFNVLTKYSDPEFMKDELYYADPSFMFDYCKKKFSKNVALLHDYDQYDFTVLVRKN